MVDENDEVQGATEEAPEPPKGPSNDIADFDVASLAEEGSVMEVRNPHTQEVLRFDDERPFTITFRGRDSEKVQRVLNSQSDRRIQAAARTRVPVTTAVIQRDDVEVMVAATIKWDIILGGKQPPSKPEAYRAAYTKFKWLLEQGDEFIGVRSNFPKK